MTLKLETVAYHSFVPSLLTGGPVLDVGCRGFDFSRYFGEKGHRVIALDPDLEIQDPQIKNVEFVHVALAACEGSGRFVVTRNPEARYVEDDGPSVEPESPRVEVKTVNITYLMSALCVKQFDLVKLNCEGAEYGILKEWPGPVATQIVFSLHEHYRPRGKAIVDAIMDHLSKWYDVVQHPYENKFSGGFNWWDTVLVLR